MIVLGVGLVGSVVVVVVVWVGLLVVLVDKVIFF